MADEKVEKLVKKRSCMKSKLTIFSNYLNTLKSCKELSSVQLLDLESRFNKFDSLYVDFDKLQCDIELLVEDPDDQSEEREQFENQYYKLAASARSLLGVHPQALTVEARMQKAKEAKVCLNCLRPGHIESKCNLVPCKYCKKQHNTLLHSHEAEITTPQLAIPVSNFAGSTSVQQNTTPPNVLLSTAIVRVADSKGNMHTARVLLDNGSTGNFVAETFCGKLAMSRRSASSTVTVNDCLQQVEE
ncbi:hypothetical protein SFRURICE_011917 [Spodoptera frugiperda]|nr:hypothetical protein SFRURICE_011917 [Spodoptera frugiperda]